MPICSIAKENGAKKMSPTAILRIGMVIVAPANIPNKIKYLIEVGNFIKSETVTGIIVHAP